MFVYITGVNDTLSVQCITFTIRVAFTQLDNVAVGDGQELAVKLSVEIGRSLFNSNAFQNVKFLLIAFTVDYSYITPPGVVASLDCVFG